MQDQKALSRSLEFIQIIRENNRGFVDKRAM
jgi:hypothetical protein